MTPYRRTTGALVLSLTLALAGCGGEPAADRTEADRTGTTQAARAGDEAPESDFCDVLAPDEIAEAFQGELPLGSMSGEPNGCRVDIEFADGGMFTYRFIRKENHDSYRGYEDQSGVPFEYLDGLGQEAFILNDSQVNVLLEDGRTLMVGLQLITIGQELPLPREELRQAVIDLARTVVERV